MGAPPTSTPPNSDLISVGINGVEAGMVKTRGIANHIPSVRVSAISESVVCPGLRPVHTQHLVTFLDGSLRGARRNGEFGRLHGFGCADMHPGALKSEAEQPSGRRGAIEQG